MQRQVPFLLALSSTTLAAAGLVGCSSEQASPSGCSPVGIAAVREALPDSLAKSRLDSHSTDADEHSFSVLYRAQDKEQVSLLGTKYEAEGAPVCPDDPNEAAQRYLELLHDDLDAQNAAQQRPANEYSPSSSPPLIGAFIAPPGRSKSQCLPRASPPWAMWR